MRDVYVIEAVRTPIGRYGGALAAVRPDDLAATVIAALLARTGVDPTAIGDVVLGCANQAGEDNRNVARMSALLAGLPVTVPGVTVNRLCGSGLQAVIDGARAITVGDAELIVAGGVESMSRAPLVMAKPTDAYPRGDVTAHDSTLGWRFVNPRMRSLYGVDPMGETAEKVAALCGVSRAAQDELALRSQRRWAEADAAGRWRAELVTVSVPGKGGARDVTRDEHPRPDTTREKLAALPPAFRSADQGGTVTAGNSSGLNDGAAALLLGSADALAALPDARARARIVASAVAGVEPALMGLGPVPATRAALARAGIDAGQLALAEVNEAFAAQAVACIEQLGLDPERVNVNGGAIALGHPLGASGARILTTLVHQLGRENLANRRYGLATMCIGVGQGIALVVEAMPEPRPVAW